MTVNELSKELGIKNKETITFLKDKGFNDGEIKSIVIALELQGLDLNKKIYD